MMSNNVDNIQITKEQTLFKMLKEHEIIIPIIQRDYAQGRNNDNVLEIRENFIKDIFKKLGDNQRLKLSFVYGTEEGSQYIPYDGQQRLTLVYLLSLYLSEYADEQTRIKVNNEDINFLSKFYYKTRDFSSDFCSYLTSNKDGFFVNNDIKTIPYDKDHRESFKKAIVNDNKFFSAWLSDPTVFSMINVLQTIHLLFNNLFEDKDDIEARKSKASDFCKKLQNDYIFFDWCSLGKASDSIYVKMNGRGKMLSAFDNFKNTLYGILSEIRENENNKINELSSQVGKEQDIKKLKIDLSMLKDFELKMDSKWTDLFWEYRKRFSESADDNINIAPAMMNFLYFAFEYRYSSKSKKFYFGKGEAVRWLDENKIVSFLTIFKDSFRSKTPGNAPVMNIDDFIWVGKLLDVLYERLYKKEEIILENSTTKRSYFTEQELFVSLCVKNANYDYRAHAIASMYYDYLIHCSDFDENSSLIKIKDQNKEEWAQIIFNIMETVGFFNSHYNDLINDKHFYVAVSAFVERAMSISNEGSIPEVMSGMTQEEINELLQFFTLHADYQFQEEYEKWKLIKQNSNWKQEIAIAESISYYDGQIYFLIEASKDDVGNPNLSTFRNLINAADSLVDKNDGSKIVDDNKLRQLLLCFGDYRIDSKQGYSNTRSLCESSVNDGTAKYYLWRSLFDVMYSNRGEYITKVLFSLSENKNDLTKAIDNSKPNDSVENWKDIIIKYPEILKYLCPFGIVDTSDFPCVITANQCKKQVREETIRNYGINIMLYGAFRELGNIDNGKIPTNLYNKWTLPTGQSIEQIDTNKFKLTKEEDVIFEGSFKEIINIAKRT